MNKKSKKNFNNLEAYKRRAKTTSKVIRNELAEHGHCVLHGDDGNSVADMLEYGSNAPDVIKVAMQNVRSLHIDNEKHKKQSEIYKKELEKYKEDIALSEDLKEKLDTANSELERYKSKQLITDNTTGGFDPSISMMDSFLELKEYYLSTQK